MARGPRPAGGVGTAPPVSSDAPKPGQWLSPQALEVFSQLVARLGNAASATHTEALNLCAMALAEVQTLSAVLNENGTTYEVCDKFGGVTIKARPEYAQRSEASRRASALLIEMGLTPVSRNRVKAGPVTGKKASGGFAEL